MGKRIPRALFRAAAALGLSFLFLAFSLLGSAEAEDASALLPEGLLLPSPSNLTPLEGEIAWNGMAAEKILFSTTADPETTIAHFRAQWKALPVEWLEAELPDGRALVVYDFHGGRRWLMAARRSVDGRTEVVRTLGPIASGEPPGTHLPFQFPEETTLVTEMRDSSAGQQIWTGTAVVEEPSEAIGAAICRAAAAEGWEGSCAFSAEAVDLQAIELRRGHKRLTLVFGAGPLEKHWLSLRWEAE